MSRHAKNSDSRATALVRSATTLTFFLCGLFIWIFKLKGSRNEDEGLLSDLVARANRKA